MDYAELSDLEEGEILEYESCPSVSSERSDQLHKKLGKLEEEFQEKIINPSKNDLVKEEGLNLKYEEENNGNKKLEDKMNNFELDDILSSDEDAKYSIITQNSNKKHKDRIRNMNYVSYGTVEDIMSQIGETISRKSKCNYKKRKSKDFKYNYDLVHQNKINFADAKPYKIFSSHYSSRLKRGKWGSDTDADTFGKFYDESIAKDVKSLKKKRKKKNLFLENKNEKEIFNVSHKKVVDFDEMRKILLEKLKKQKAEEELKNTQEVENSEIQEVEMIIECTNYVDKPNENPNGTSERKIRSEISVDDEESDLMKLRSMALASKEKRKVVEDVNEIPEGGDLEKLSTFGIRELKKTENDDEELDRNELLLRAEALKTALLKKHQKRLNKIRKERVNNLKNCDETQEGATFPSDEFLKKELGETKENLDKKPPEENETDETSRTFDCNLDKENINKGSRPGEEGFKEENCSQEHSTLICTTNSGLKRCVPKSKMKKKKRKSFSLECRIKENDNNETPEEDDKTLRFQLLTDLLKKKSQKNSDRKSVLLDSIQTSSKAPVEGNANVEIKVQPVSAQNNLAKKNYENQTKKPIRVPKPEIQRIIVHLGPDESSDEEPKLSLPQASSGSDSTSVKMQKVPTNEDATVANYEKNVDLLLSRARQKIEEEMKKTNEVILTPEAVYKHLPPSQRLEYIRLKQKIAERERLKKLKKDNLSQTTKIATDSFRTGTVNPETLVPKVSSISSQNYHVSSCSNAYTNTTTFVGTPLKFGRSNCGILSSTGKKVTLPSKAFSLNKTPEHRKTLNSLVFNNCSTLGKKQNFKSIPSKKYVAPNKLKNSHQNHFLTSSNQGITAKLKLLLKKIKIEKTIEENYEKEIVKLKTQISLFEKKKSEQQFKIKKLAEESMKIYKLLQTNKKECSNLCGSQQKEQKEGTNSEKSAVEPKQVFEDQNNTIGEVKDQETPELHIIEREKAEKMANINAEVKCNGVDPMEYNSPLQVFSKAPEENLRVDPNVIMCHFDLMGVCKDEECSYQHLNRKFGSKCQRRFQRDLHD